MPVAMLSSSLITEPKRYGRFNALDTENPFRSKPGMVLVSPTSIDHSGTSATLGENGQVTFNAVTSLSLNGVFTADFDNYVISIQHDNATDSNSYSLQGRLRLSGSDASGTNYTRQRLSASSTTVSAERTTGADLLDIGRGSGTPSGQTIFVYGPFLAQPTAFRNIGVDSSSGATIGENVMTHSLSTSYDGITIYPGSGKSITGTLTVMGVRS